MILVKDLLVKRGKDFSLRCVDCVIKRNAVNLIVGPNGSGKTTFIKAVLGLVSCVKRIVYNDGILLDKRKTLLFRKKTGYAPQEISFSNLNIFNVRYAMELAFWKRENYIGNIQKEINNALEICGLSSKYNFPVSSLSGGEKRRFLIARALATSVNFVFLDEPDAFLDFDFVKKLPVILLKYKELKNLTMIISSHNYEVFRNIGDVLISVKNGNVKCENKMNDGNF